MRISFLLAVEFFLVVVFGAQAQQDIMFSGTVIDGKSKQPLPNAALGIQNKSIGVVANAVGEFEFNIPMGYANDTVYISYIGYKTFKERVSNLQRYTGKAIAMEEAFTMLEEITVKDKQLDARSIVEDALREVHNVYPTEPCLMDVFQRSWEKLEFVDSLIYPGKLLESASVVYDPGYTR